MSFIYIVMKENVFRDGLTERYAINAWETAELAEAECRAREARITPEDRERLSPRFDVDCVALCKPTPTPQGTETT